MCLGKPWVTKMYQKKEQFFNWLIVRVPAWIQILFMERVLKSVEASFAQKEEDCLLLSQKEGNLREWRRYRPSNPFRTPRMDLQHLSRDYQPEVAQAKLYGGNRRAHHSALQGWYAHLGQRRARARQV